MRDRLTRPARSSTRRCLDTAGPVIANGSPSSPTVAGPRLSRARIARRVGSARAAKTRLSGSRLPGSSAIELTTGPSLDRTHLGAVLRPLLEEPGVAVGVLEAGVEHAAEVLGIPHRDALGEESAAGAVHVGHDEVDPLLHADGHVGDLGDVAAQEDRAARSGRVDLDDPHVTHLDVVGDELPPALLDVEVARAIDVADGDVDELEAHLDGRGHGGHRGLLM